MTKVTHRYLVKDSGAMRYASEYVYDPRDLDFNGNPPSWFIPQTKCEIEDGEIEFDHVPGEVERAAAFKRRKDNGNNGP